MALCLSFSIISCKFCQCIFVISPFENVTALHLNKLEFPLPMDVLYQVWLKLASMVGNLFSNFINLFSLLSSLGNGVAFHLNKLEFPLHKNTWGQVWLKLAQWSGEDYIKFCQITFTFEFLFHLGKGRGPSIEQSSSSKEAFSQVWLKLAQQFLKLID